VSDHFIARRDFLKSTVAGFSGFFFLADNAKKLGKRIAEKKPANKKIIYRTLGNTGIKLPVINMGVMNSDNPNLVRAALNSGVILLDTAQTYQRGTNEAMIGEVLKERPRDSYVLATKARLPVNQNTGLYTQEATEEAFQHKIDTSLKNLKLDYVDIYYHHNVWVRESALYEPILKALEKAKKAGKARFVGISTHKNEPEVIQAAIDSKFYDVVLTTYNFKQKHYAEVRKAVAKAAAAGLGVVVMKALGGRQLQESAEKPVDAVAALKWVLQDPHVHTIIPGFTTFDQMNLDLSVMDDPALTLSEKAQLEWAASQVGLYCQGCRQCLNQCGQQLPIPDLMRAYMYGYGYRNLREAQDLVFSLDLPAQVCPDCCQCSVDCLSGFNVAARIRKIVRLRDVPADFIA
jgi:predicted aldo/keto reductase-like oxidoreductase